MKEKNVVITGYVYGDQPYSVIKENVIKQGGIIKGSVTSKTDYLIYNPKRWGVNPATGEKVNLSETTKLKKAPPKLKKKRILKSPVLMSPIKITLKIDKKKASLLLNV